MVLGSIALDFSEMSCKGTSDATVDVYSSTESGVR